jgi:hypothetical protein
VTISKRRVWRGSVVPQIKPLLLVPLHRSGHGNIEIGVDSMPELGMNNHATRDY